MQIKSKTLSELDDQITNTKDKLERYKNETVMSLDAVRSILEPLLSINKQIQAEIRKERIKRKRYNIKKLQ